MPTYGLSIPSQFPVIRIAGSGGELIELPQSPDAVSTQQLIGQSLDAAAASGTGTITAGTLYLWKVPVYDEAISAVLLTITTALVGGTAGFIGIYDADGTQSASMTAANTTATTTFQGATGNATITLASPVTGLVSGSSVYVALLVTGTPSTNLVLRTGTASVILNHGLTAATGFRAGTGGTGLSALPASVTLSSMVISAILPWIGLKG